MLSGSDAECSFQAISIGVTLQSSFLFYLHTPFLVDSPSFGYDDHATQIGRLMVVVLARSLQAIYQSCTFQQLLRSILLSIPVSSYGGELSFPRFYRYLLLCRLADGLLCLVLISRLFLFIIPSFGASVIIILPLSVCVLCVCVCVLCVCVCVLCFLSCPFSIILLSFPLHPIFACPLRPLHILLPFLFSFLVILFLIHPPSIPLLLLLVFTAAWSFFSYAAHSASSASTTLHFPFSIFLPFFISSASMALPFMHPSLCCSSSWLSSPLILLFCSFFSLLR